MQGGKIWAESKIGHGSTFSFQLLFQSTEEAKPVAPQVAPPKREFGDEPHYDFNGARVLIAEDNSVNQMLLIRILEKLNINTEVAENGEIVLEMLEKADYDLILMDMQMPEMDGYTATESIRKYGSEVKAALPIIALTANSGIEDAKKCFKAGANEYISKPFKQLELIEKLAKFLPYKKG